MGERLPCTLVMYSVTLKPDGAAPTARQVHLRGGLLQLVSRSEVLGVERLPTGVALILAVVITDAVFAELPA
jgi:hypothetical protein